LAARAWCGRVVAHGDTGTPFGIAGGDRVYFGQSNTKVHNSSTLWFFCWFLSQLTLLFWFFSFVEFSFVEILFC
jgi:hypothetical protein